MEGFLSHASSTATARNLDQPRSAPKVSVKRTLTLVGHGRLTAAASCAGIVAHLEMVSAGGWMVALGLSMAIACVPCAWTMWRQPTMRTARMLVGMSLAMAILHAALILGAAPPTEHVHARTAPISDVAADHSSHVAPALAVIGADFVTAWLSASWLRRVAGSVRANPRTHGNIQPARENGEGEPTGPPGLPSSNPDGPADYGYAPVSGA